MKANEVPEKLYVNFHFMETHPWSYQPLVTKQGVNKYDIEYIRTDTFIEKTNKWLSLNLKMLMNVLDVEYDTHETDVKDFVEDFKRYIKQ